MPKQIVIAEQQQVAAVFSEDRIEELVVANSSQQVGDICLGTVENVIPGIDAAFVNIGDSERNGFMHVTDLGPLKLKRSGAITELLAPQQKVVVQIMKEPTGNKGPRLTGNVTLPGRYLVLMPYSKGVSLSRHIENEGERGRLRALAILIKPAGMGLIVRTEAEGQPEDDIIKDLESLKQQWESVQRQANAMRPPALLNRDDDFVQRVLRDIYTAEVNRIAIDTASGLKRVKQQLATWSGGRLPSGLLIEHHRDRQAILDYFRVNAAIREAIKPRVDLPSGGHIVIEPTEALTVIDVNSGSFTRSATSRETVLWTNCEAAVEVARQLRLRKIGGIIIVDFIDMDLRRDQLKVLEIFNEALKTDKARPQIVQVSELGLFELTRKRQGQSLYEVFGKACPTCGGLGHLVQLPGAQEVEALLSSPSTSGGAVLPAARVSAPVSGSGDRRSRELDRLATLPASPEEGEPEIELLHHPSYQEQGSGGNNNRRRRRRDSMGTRSGEASSRGKHRGGGDTAASESSRPQRDRKPQIETAATEPAEETATPRRERSAPETPATAEPPKTIAVPMTTFEQDMYALMGLSPAVRLDDPDAVSEARKAILVPVDPDADEALALAMATAEAAVDAQPVETSGAGVTSEPAVAAVAVVDSPETDASASDAAATDPAAEAAETTPVVEESASPRRRRRRSSAAASN